MSEKIGNAITDQKSTVELMTADTAIVSGEDAVAIAGGVSVALNSTNGRAEISHFVAYRNGKFYSLYSSYGGEFEVSEITFPS